MKYLRMLFVALGGLLISSPAYALLITPDTYNGTDWSYDTDAWSGPETSQSAIDSLIASIITPSVELYKADFNPAMPPTESGALAGSYSTTFSPDTEDPTSATINYLGGDYVGPNAYALVKDGNNNPGWYLFDLTAAGWDGMEVLQFDGFWAGGPGSISHIALYGESTPVPEPATMLLFGAGLAGLAGLGRRRLLQA
ncbi:PEP-CTERM sorting domain-containing protein [Desulfurivibrio sp. D14AmB]|uniref:PEP-CTERM sorting domain-containing protein n=1 Tax=Desulfurivibrio sp. D14AmB TaxID=3374370 RepID=UPI00376F2EC0